MKGKKPAQAGLKAEQMTNGELQLRHNKTRRVWDNFSLFLSVLSCARAPGYQFPNFLTSEMPAGLEWTPILS